jgi:hypothetical protein
MFVVSLYKPAQVDCLDTRCYIVHALALICLIVIKHYSLVLSQMLVGGIITLGLSAAVPMKHPDGKPEDMPRKILRRLYPIVAVMSILSEFIAIIWCV